MNDKIEYDILIKNIIDVHITLHGKNIVVYAIVDDIQRQTGYKYEKDKVTKDVNNVLYSRKE